MTKREEPPQGAPGWMVTYGDIMSLLLCFFIALVSMSEIRKDRFQQAMDSIHRAFGGVGRAADHASPGHQKNSLIEKLLAIPIEPITTNGMDDPGNIHDQAFRVNHVPQGLEIVIGGAISFDPFSAALRPEAKELITRIAEQLHGYNTKLVVRGHADREPLPPGSMYHDERDLSYARGAAVADELEQNGVRRVRLSVVAVGDTEPLVKQAQTEARRAVNRRVEILVKEELSDDIAGTEPVQSFKESSYGQ